MYWKTLLGIQIVFRIPRNRESQTTMQSRRKKVADFLRSDHNSHKVTAFPKHPITVSATPRLKMMTE
jgi:hypothetical protein